MTRHVTLLTVKAVTREGGRWIEGYATTATQDRVGDVVLPEGARYQLPIPLLFAHKHDEPIGSVVEASVTKAGIRIRAKLTEGVARAEEVWKLIMDGALTAVSIGFQALKHTPLANGGLRFDEWSWHELSVVSVPANPEARISVAKCMAYTAGGQEPEAVSKWIPVAPRRNDEDELTAFYRRYDAAISVLPDHVTRAAHFTRAFEVEGFMEFHGVDGKPLARVRMLDGEASYPGQPVKAKQAKPRPAVSAGMSADERKLLLAVATLQKGFDERLAELEASSMRFRGYWKPGAIAKSGDCFTHNGSLHRASTETDDEPGKGSADWVVLARKGSDAK